MALYGEYKQPKKKKRVPKPDTKGTFKDRLKRKKEASIKADAKKYGVSEDTMRKARAKK